MQSEYIKTEINNKIARVTLARPNVHNALDENMVGAITDTFTNLCSDKNARVIVLQSEGDFFCAGADLNWMKEVVNFNFGKNLENVNKLANMFLAIYNCPKVTIARVQGDCFGGALGLISACDITVAQQNANFCFSEVRLGLIPAVISPFVLRKISVAHAHRYFLTAERFSAAEAQRIGLVSELVADAKDLNTIIDELLIRNILKNGPQAISHSKKLINETTLTNNINKQVEHSINAIAERRISEEGQEGMHAFLEKRPPSWIRN